CRIRYSSVILPAGRRGRGLGRLQVAALHFANLCAVAECVVSRDDDDLTGLEAGEDLDPAFGGQPGLDGAPEGPAVLDDEDRRRARISDDGGRGYEAYAVAGVECEADAGQESGSCDLRGLGPERHLDRDQPGRGIGGREYATDAGLVGAVR